MAMWASAPGPASTQGQRVVEAMPSSPTKQEPAPKPYHEVVTEAYHFCMNAEERERFDRGRAKRRAYFLQHAEAVYIDALDSVSVVERMEALRKIIDVFEPDPEVAADDALLELQVKTVNAILEMLALEDDENMPKAQALCLRALIALYPMSPDVEPPPKKDPKDKKSKFVPPPKRVPAGRKAAATKDTGPKKNEHPNIVDRSEDPLLSAVLATALKFTNRGAAWYVRVWALRLVSRIAPWTIILGLHNRKEEPNAETAVVDLAKLVEDEVNDQIRYSLIETVFKMQVFAHLPHKVRNPFVVSLADRMMVDPCINIRILILQELGPTVNTDHYSSQSCDKEALSTILCMFHDTSATMRCLAMDTIIKKFPKKDDQSILNQITEQIRDLKNSAFLRRRLTAAKQILPLLKKEVPPEMQLPSSPIATSPRESSQMEEAQEEIPQNEGRELSVLVVAALASEGNKMVIHDTVKLLADEEHLVRLAAAKVLAHLAPDDPAAVTLILKFIEGMSVEEKKKLAVRNSAAMQKNSRQPPRNNVTSRNQPTPRGQSRQTEQPKAEAPEEPEEKGREWIKIMAGVYALQLVVGNGPGREQMLKEIARLFPHYDSTVRHAVVEILHAIGGGDTEDGGRGGAQYVIKAALPLLKSESWTAREIALQVVGGLVVPGEQEYFQPLLSSLSDSSWPVRHEAVMSVIKVFDGCTDPANFKELIKIAAPPEVQGKMLDGPDGLLKQSVEGEGFVLALDALRILTESDEDMRHMLGGLLKAELRIAPGAEMSPHHLCEGTWLLQQPVSAGVAILLESRKSQLDAIARSRTEVTELKRIESGSTFSKALSKFRGAAAAEFIPEPLNSDELTDMAPELPPGVDTRLALIDNAPIIFAAFSGVTPPLNTTASSHPDGSLEENAESATMQALPADGHGTSLETSGHAPADAAETLVTADKLEETAGTACEDQGNANVTENSKTPKALASTAQQQTLSGLPVLPSPRAN